MVTALLLNRYSAITERLTVRTVWKILPCSCRRCPPFLHNVLPHLERRDLTNETANLFDFRKAKVVYFFYSVDAS